ncbi:hypothetical protein [uncultured Campylobacter sp.]|uniref:hypothetical protein n=1 Tax=uncultured Campylobacter sp. TaxID=218934 RepID=UPI0026088E76|nr:hypothetical protein [uncultured Campylobacter sp.]
MLGIGAIFDPVARSPCLNLSVARCGNLLLKFHSASAIEISLKRFVIFKVRVNLTHIALPVPLVDFAFGIFIRARARAALKFIAAPFFDAAAAFKFMFAAVENFIFAQILS